jgi:hypothetical protein
MVDLHNRLLDFQGHRDELERSLGRGGAPVNLDRARAVLPETEAALRKIADLLSDTQ